VSDIGRLQRGSCSPRVDWSLAGTSDRSLAQRRR